MACGLWGSPVSENCSWGEVRLVGGTAKRTVCVIAQQRSVIRLRNLDGYSAGEFGKTRQFPSSRHRIIPREKLVEGQLVCIAGRKILRQIVRGKVSKLVMIAIKQNHIPESGPIVYGLTERIAKQKRQALTRMPQRGLERIVVRVAYV
jgi:hypothetical protein